MTCTHCGATSPDDAERCRKCLRRTGLVASPPAAPEATSDAPRREAGGLRGILVFGALVIAVAIVLVAFRIFFLPE
jgi:hypothetical protein